MEEACLAVLIGCVGTRHGLWLPVGEGCRLRLPPNHMRSPLARKELTCDCIVALLLHWPGLFLGPDRSVRVRGRSAWPVLHELSSGCSDTCELHLTYIDGEESSCCPWAATQRP